MESNSQRMSRRQKIGVLVVALTAGICSIPVGAQAVDTQYWSGSTVGGQYKGSSQATMNGGKGWAVTARTFNTFNVYSWQSQIAGATSTNGSVASFSHAPVAGAFSNCYWGSSSDGSVKVGMTCKHSR